MTKEVVHHLEMAQDRQSLAGFEELLRQRLKLKSLGLSSLQRSIAHKESRLLWRSEGGCSHQILPLSWLRSNHIHSLSHEGNMLVAEERKAEVAFSFFNKIWGSPHVRSCAIKLGAP
jgi:hypothetical protein